MAEEERHHSAAETSSAVTTADDIPPPASDPAKEKVVVDEAKDGAAITPQSEAERQERYRQVLASKVNFITLLMHLPLLTLLTHLTLLKSHGLSLTVHGRSRS